MSDKPEGYVFGRPTTYRPEYCQLLIEHMKQGLSFESFGAVVGCSSSTLYEWVAANEDFSSAKKLATEYCRIFWEKIAVDNLINTSEQWGKGQAKSKALNSTVWIFNMKNRFKWRDNIDVEHSGNQEKPAFIFAYTKEDLEKIKK